MAIFHLSAVIHSRGKGHSAVAGAAYRARTSMLDERTGERHDYGRKAKDVLFEGIYAPRDAPEWTKDRAQLWNHVEAFEKRRDAQLARVYDIALPHELTLEQNRRLLQDWIRENFTRKGLIADAVIHAPDRESDPRNIHAHVAVVLRKLDGTEFAAKKERAVSIEERKGELEAQRESWEKLANRHLERAGREERIDRRTLKEQGIDREPEKHLGPDATALERAGIESELGNANREIAERNAERERVAALEAETQRLQAQIIDLAAERARREAERGGPESTRPLDRTSGDIRTAWNLTRTSGAFEEALAARGISLAVVSAEEARQSERNAAFARATGGFNRTLTEGEIVAVNSYGEIRQLDRRSTGALHAIIEPQLAGVDRAALLSIADAAAAMREAGREAFIAERQAERERARPRTAIEERIAQCAEQARMFGAIIEREDATGRRIFGAEALAIQLDPTGERTSTRRTEFGPEALFARLQEAGITIVRATAADVIALAALRQQEQDMREATEGVRAYKQHHFAQLAEGDLAAVTRNGDVHRISAGKLGGAERHLPAELPGIVETRAAQEIDRERTSALWGQKRAEAAELREARAAEREDRARAADRRRDRRETIRNLDGATAQAGKTTTRALTGLAKIVEGAFGLLFGWAMAPAKLTPMQAELKERADEEKQQESEYRDYRAAQEVTEEQRFWQIMQSAREEDERRERDNQRWRDRERER